jgi:hypothetical protein
VSIAVAFDARLPASLLVEDRKEIALRLVAVQDACKACFFTSACCLTNFLPLLV